MASCHCLLFKYPSNETKVTFLFCLPYCYPSNDIAPHKLIGAYYLPFQVIYMTSQWFPIALTLFKDIECFEFRVEQQHFGMRKCMAFNNKTEQ